VDEREAILTGVVDEEPRDPVLEALWKRVLEGWNEEGRHAALIDHALRTQRLPDAAGRYRALAEDPERGTLARKKLDAIVLAATQMLMALQTPRRAKVPLPITLSAVGICAALLAGLAWSLWGHR
jgi:hypothetical protein